MKRHTEETKETENVGNILDSVGVSTLAAVEFLSQVNTQLVDDIHQAHHLSGIDSSLGLRGI